MGTIPTLKKGKCTVGTGLQKYHWVDGRFVGKEREHEKDVKND